MVMAALIGFPSPAFAQVVKGSISGTVQDTSGATVPDADVHATQMETSQVFSAKTDDSGLFRLSLLPVGTYRVEIRKEGFNLLHLNDVAVSAGQDRGLGILTLALGPTTATVEVTAAPPLVQSTQAQISTTFSSQKITGFPGVLENQGLDNMALFVPGVNSARDLGFSNTNGTSFAVNGLRGRNNDQQVDGQNNNDNSVGGPSLFVSNAEFVEEYQITTSNFGAEYGRNSGSVVNIITKSGTNNWKGTIFGTVGNSALDSLSNNEKHFQGLTKPPRYQDTFVGGTAGGPLVKDRIFFFGGFDTQIISSTDVVSAARTPTPVGLATLAACFPGSAGIQALMDYGPYGVTGGNPQVSGATSLIAVTGPVSGTICNNVQVSGVQRLLDNSLHQYDYILRTDVNPTDKDRIYARYIYQRATFLNADSFGTAAAGYPANVPSRTHGLGVSWTRTITSRMVNEARFNWGQLEVQFGGNGIGNTTPPMSDIDQALARITFSDTSLLGFGPATNAPQGRIVKTMQLQDNWSYFLGKHQLKAGVNYTYQHSPNRFLPNLNSAWRFANLGALGDNVPNRITIANGDPLLDFREHQTFLYFGDDYQIRQNLILNLGVTYSLYGQPANLFHENTVKRESDASTAFWNPALPIELRTFPAIPAPKNNWGPSLGFAYTPHWGGWLTGEGKTVIRGGYRIAYDPPFYNIYLNISSSAPQVFLQTIGSSVASTIPMPAAPTGPTVRSLLSSFLTLGVFDPRTFAQTSVTNDLGPQRVHNWSFGIQREIRPNAVIEARYIGNRGTNLFQSINKNPLVADLVADYPGLFPGITPCPAAQAEITSAIGRVYCDMGIVRERTNTGFSNYHGLQLNFRGSNLWKQLTLNTGYTWSKTTDNASEIFGTFGGGGTIAFSQNPLDYQNGEKGLSGLDIPHNWNLTFQEELPFFRTQKGWLGKFLGGWAISGSYIISSGQTYTPAQFALAAFSGALYNDTNFNTTFAGTFDTSRPFVGNPGAPLTSVGIFAQDACNNFGLGCSQPTGTLLSLNDINASGFVTETVVSPNDVRFIVNGLEANGIFGSPFGNAGRNILRNYQTNTANFSLFKVTKFGERAAVRWHMTMTNVFNHPNFASVDPFIDDAGLTDEATGFGNVRLFDGGNRNIRFGLRISF
jgi:hypothetical protein